MAKLIKTPSVVKAAGTKEKIIREYIGKVKGGAEYIAVCVPAFSPDTVNRDK